MVCSALAEPTGICTEKIASINSGIQPMAERDVSVTNSLVGAGLVAAVLAAILIMLFVMKSRSEYAERPDEMEIGTMNPTVGSKGTFPESDTGALSASAVGMLAPFAIGALPLAALSQRGDRLWMDFRRCASFDSMYFGNPVLKLSDEALRDVYAILRIPCPPVSYFQPLRAVGDQFLRQAVGREGYALTDVEVIEDTADFVAAAMADVLVERAIDLCATIANANVNYNDATVYEAFVAMVNVYDPENNHFLTTESAYEEIRGLRRDACDRAPDDKDPIYWEISDRTSTHQSEYASAADYALSRSQGGRQQESDYDFGSDYPIPVTMPCAVGDDYAVASAENEEATYGTANHIDEHESVYHKGTKTEPLYTPLEITDDLEDEPTYSLGVAGCEPAYAFGSTLCEPSYALGSTVSTKLGTFRTLERQTTERKSPFGSEPVYSFSQTIDESHYDVGSAIEPSINLGFDNQGYVPGGESLYATASNEEEIIAREQYEAEAYTTGDRSMLKYHVASALADAEETTSRDSLLSLAALEDDPDFQEFATKFETGKILRNVGDLPRRGSATLPMRSTEQTV
jgi:hypothetical protein